MQNHLTNSLHLRAVFYRLACTRRTLHIRKVYLQKYSFVFPRITPLRFETAGNIIPKYIYCQVCVLLFRSTHKAEIERGLFRF